MGQRTKGGMWCEICRAPTLGVKTTARMRNTVMTVALPLTGGASVLGYRSDDYMCQRCGSPVVHAPGRVRKWARQLEDQELARRAAERAAELAAQLEAEAARPLRPEEDWRTMPAAAVPPWRRVDRAALDVQQANAERSLAAQSGGRSGSNGNLASQLADLAALHKRGALTDEEFAAAKARVLGHDE